MSNCECNDYISISAVYAKMEKGVSSDEILTLKYRLCGTNKNIVWTSTDDDILTVSYDKKTNKVTVTAKAVGTATVYAQCKETPGISDYCIIEVLDKMPVTSVKVEPDDITIEKGETKQLKTTVYPLGAGNRKLSWCSCAPDIATVNDKGVITAKKKGSATIVARATDGSGASDVCNVRVTEPKVEEPVGVDCVTVSYSEKTMTIGDIGKLEAIVCPPNANDRSVIWESSNTNAVIVDCCGNIEAVGVGEADIKAISNFDNSKKSICHVTVKNDIKITSVEVRPETEKIMNKEMVKVNCIITPLNATHNEVVFTSSNTSVATVDSSTGWVTSKSGGTTYITATVSDREKTYTATCKIEVDPRENVYILKDGDFFIVQFRGGKRWKSTGKILQHPNWYDVEVTEPRFIHNRAQHFTEEQLAFLYLLDPVGVVNFMKNEYSIAYNVQGVDLLLVKDRIYEKIFGVKPRYFIKGNDGDLIYKNYNNGPTRTQRDGVNSDAEILFGAHAIVGAYEIGSFLMDVIPALFSLVPGVNLAVQLGVQLVADAVDLMFFSGSVTELFSNQASTYLEGYIEEDNNLNNYIDGTAPLERIDMFGWLDVIVSVLESINDIYSLPEANLPIYQKVRNNGKYVINIVSKCNDLTIEDIIGKCNVVN